MKALIKTAAKNGYTMEVLTAVENVNERQKERLFEKLSERFCGDLKGRRIALWGLAFKPDTDDMREAPALRVIARLLEAGADVVAYDPVAMDECRRRIGDTIYYASDIYEAALDADAILLLTEWKQFRLPSWKVLKRTMRTPLVIDGRNIYDADELRAEGFEYTCIGRK